MERLTELLDGRYIIPLRYHTAVQWAICESKYSENLEKIFVGDFAKKLAAYEDTGLTPAEIEATKAKLAQAMELLELAVGDLSEYTRCLKCKHHKKNYGDCIGMNFCQESEYHEKWQWKHADKLAELKGEL